MQNAECYITPCTKACDEGTVPCDGLTKVTAFRFFLQFFLIRYFRQIWHLPNCKIIIFVDIYGDAKPNYEIQSLNYF